MITSAPAGPISRTARRPRALAEAWSATESQTQRAPPRGRASVCTGATGSVITAPPHLLAGRGTVRERSLQAVGQHRLSHRPGGHRLGGGGKPLADDDLRALTAVDGPERSGAAAGP